jgi:hypothetical protein
MPPTSTSSIGIAFPSIHRRLRRWLAHELVSLQPTILHSAAVCRSDRYRKTFDTMTHTCLLLFHGLSGSPSLRQSYAAFPACESLTTLCGWPTAPETRPPVSFSQWAASNSSRSPTFLAGLIPSLVERVRQLAPQADLPPDLTVLDGTRLRLPQTLVPWTTCHLGVGVQVCYQPALDLPEQVVVLANEKTKDVQGMDQAILDDPSQLARLQGQTLTVDLGYHSHDRFRRLLEAGIHLVTRLHPQAKCVVLEDLPVQQSLAAVPTHRIGVLSDQRVRLGSENNRRTKCLLDLRLVTATVLPLPRNARRQAATITYRILTDRWDLTAHQVIHRYLLRWQIELFFRWLKRVIKLVRPLGTKGREVVTLSVWLAVVIHLLTVLAAHALGLPRRTPTLLHLLRVLLFSTQLALLPHHPPPVQLTLFPSGFS